MCCITVDYDLSSHSAVVSERIMKAKDLQQRMAEVYISPKINISARTLKMALHKNPVMHCDRVVIFLHGSQKKAFSLHN